jgi:lysozyme family protein
MAESNFDAVMAFVFEQEGGFANLPGDSGCWTNFGITHLTLQDWLGRPVTEDDVRNMTKETASAIYAANYWNRMRCGDLAVGIDLMVMDFGVNAGPGTSAKMLQKAIGLSGAQVDGWIGPQTLALANSLSASGLLTSINIMQALYYRSLNSPYTNALMDRENRRYALAKSMVGRGISSSPTPVAAPVESTPAPDAADQLMAAELTTLGTET